MTGPASLTAALAAADPGPVAAAALAVGVGTIITLLGAAIIGAARWAAAINRATHTAATTVAQLVEQLTGLAADVRDLAASSQDAGLVRAELHAHIAVAEERWRLVGGLVPYPRATPERRRRTPQPATEPAGA